MAKLTLDTLSTLRTDTAVDAYNENSERIEDALENTLSRDGTEPNDMNADLDMDGNRIMNLPAPVSGSEPARKADLDALTFNSGVFVNRRYIDVAEYCDSSDLVDATDGIEEAFAAGEGMEIVFTPRHYRSLTRQRIILPEKARIIFEPNADFDFSDWDISGAFTANYAFFGDGDEGTEYVVSGGLARGDTSILLIAPPNPTIVSGQRLYLKATAQLTTLEGSFTLADNDCARSEAVIVDYVDGSTVYLTGALQDTYTDASNPKLQALTGERELIIEGANLIGPGHTSSQTGDGGFYIGYGKNCHVKDSNFFNVDAFGVRYNATIDSTISSCNITKALGASPGSSLGFSVLITDGCERVAIRDCNAVGGYQGFVLSNTGHLGITRNVHFYNCSTRNMLGGGFTTHNGHELWSVVNCTAIDGPVGIDNRVSKALFQGNTIKNTTTGIVHRIAPSFIRMYDNYIETVSYGVRLEPDDVPPYETTPGNISIKNNVMRNVSLYGVLWEFEYLLDPATGLYATAGGSYTDIPNIAKIEVTNNDIEMETTGIGISVGGKTTDLIVKQNHIIGSSVGRAIFVHDAGNGVGNGPVSPIVTDNAFASNYPDPQVLINNHTGTINQTNNRTHGIAPVTTITAADSPYTMLYTDEVILCNATAGNITVIPPSATVRAKFTPLTVKKIDVSGNSVTIDPSGATTIDGAATKATTTQWEAITFRSDGSNFYTV